ncbi:MAG: hypothetical protein CMO26_19630 [Thiotrichales bacterium]|nr:hypothetical protein [Thiotrichales bacterium]|tara:strand:- start:11101 stop:11451 length:351 start_codon:yes stop_codon:yes gene_type:complete
MIWLAVLVAYGPQWFNGAEKCVVLEGGATLEQVVRDGLVPADSVECPPSAVGTESLRWSLPQVLVGILSVFVLFFSMLAAAEGSRCILRYRKYQSDIRDHRALLHKYGRADEAFAS